MGMSASARLVYGYDLGGDNNGWKLQQTDKYGCLDVEAIDWLEEDDELAEKVEERLLATIGGFTEKWAPNVDGYWDRERAAKERVGVKIVFYSHSDYSMHVLGIEVIDQDWSEGVVLDLPALAAMPEANGWDAKLAAAIEALGITPTQTQPGWILCAAYG